MEIEELKNEIIGEINIEYFEQFFGKSKDYYIPKLIAHENGKKFSFNLSAFLFGHFWVLYHRMYLNAFILFVIIVVESKFENILLKILGNTYNIDMSLRYLWYIIFGTLVGNLGDYFFLEHSKKRVKKIISTTDEEEIKMKKLKKSGSGNWILVVIFVSVMVLSIIFGKK